jgi:hypothetical protein
MTYHLTQSGHVELLDSWGHGKGPRCQWHHAVAVVVVDDGDGHEDAWKFSGKRAHALNKLAEFWCEKQGVAVIEGNRLTLEQAPDDLWVEDDNGDFHPDTAKYPNILA